METWRVVLDSPKPWILAHCETSGALLGVRKLGMVAHEKLGVCNRGFGETSGAFVETSGCFFVVWVWCVRCLPFLPFQCVQPFRHSCILGTFVGSKELK